ncbi:MAG: hypothetical protein R3C11_15085 [Planctomycetaceae bacterium]
MFRTVLLIGTLALSLACNLLFATSPESEVPLNQLISGLKEREQLLNTFEIVVRTEERAGKDFHDYWNDSDTSQAEIMRYYGVEGQPPVKRVAGKEVRHLGMIRQSPDSITLLMLSEPSLTEADGIQFMEHWNGELWQSHWPLQEVSRVHLEDHHRISPPDTLFGLSLSTSLVSLDNLRQFIEDNSSDPEQISNVSVRTDEDGNQEYLVTLTANSIRADLADHVKYEMELVFSAKLGFAPISITGYAASQQTGKRSGDGFKGRWSEFKSTENGAFIPQKFLLDFVETCDLPKDPETGFQPLIIGGKEVMDDMTGHPRIDPSSMITKTYDQTTQWEQTLVSHSPTVTEASPAFPISFSAGTIVQDNRNQNLYTLVQAGPAFGAGLGPVQLEPLAPVSAIPAAPAFSSPQSAGTTLYPLLLIVIALLLVVLLSIYLFKRKLN